jgi:hypothetical protein
MLDFTYRITALDITCVRGLESLYGKASMMHRFFQTPVAIMTDGIYGT